jgi:hypothetical protein
LSICILPIPLHHLQRPHSEADDFHTQSLMTFQKLTHWMLSTSCVPLCSYLSCIRQALDALGHVHMTLQHPITWWYTIGTISMCRPKQADSFWCILAKLGKRQWLPVYKRRQLSTHAKLTTFCSLFLCIKPSQHLAISVCPVYNHLYPCLLCYLLISDHL